MAKDLLYRQWLEQKLKEAISNLDTDRGLMSHSSQLYKNLRKTIDDVLEVLEKHNGEEWLEPEDKTELETKIGLMLEANKPYLEDKINKGGLAEGRVPTTLRRRCMGAFSISLLVPKIVDDAEQYDIPDNLRDPDDVEYTDRFHKYKQKVRY